MVAVNQIYRHCTDSDGELYIRISEIGTFYSVCHDIADDYEMRMKTAHLESLIAKGHYVYDGEYEITY